MHSGEIRMLLPATVGRGPRVTPCDARQQWAQNYLRTHEKPSILTPFWRITFMRLFLACVWQRNKGSNFTFNGNKSHSENKNCNMQVILLSDHDNFVTGKIS